MWCRKEKKRPTTITLTDLQDVYHLPISNAAKKFDIGLTLLKKRCRELGLRRWPYRKLKSMDKLLQSIESVDGQDPQVRASNIIAAYCCRGSVISVRSILRKHEPARAFSSTQSVSQSVSQLRATDNMQYARQLPMQVLWD